MPIDRPSRSTIECHPIVTTYLNTLSFTQNTNMSEDIEGAINYLETAAENAPASVMQHVGETIVSISDFGADRPIDYFEAFSYIIKEKRQGGRDPLLDLHALQGPNFVLAREALARTQMNLFSRQRLTAEGEEEEEDDDENNGEGDEQENNGEEKHEEEETVNEDGEIPNILADNRYMHQVGVGLSESEAGLLQQAVQKLVRGKPLATARFWGKVIGVERDYYIVEAEYNDGERPHDEPNEEEEKNEAGEEGSEKEQRPPIEEDAGPNLYNYFVCTALGGKWTLLPDIKPDQIVASRSIRHLFTGDLNAPVLAPPGRFEGTEKELLRCFIARVVHSCTLAPKGLYNPEEEPEEEEELESNAPIVMEEEWTPKPLPGMEGFVHRTAYILPQGRVEFWAPETEEEEPEPVVEKGPPILRPITLDEPIGDNVPSWSMRVIHTTRKHYWLRSNTWPGLNILSTDNGDKLVMLYYGWGMKSTPPVEWPPLPEPKPKPKPVEEEEEKHEVNEEEEKTDGEGNPTESGTYDESGYSSSNA